MLGQFATARFASHHSPTRERREILFASTNDPNQRQQREAGREGVNERNTPRDLEAMIAGHRFTTREQAMAASGESLRESARSEDVQGILVDADLPSPPHISADEQNELKPLHDALRTLSSIDAELKREDLPARRRQRLLARKTEMIAASGEKNAIAERLLQIPEVLHRVAIDLQAAMDRFEQARSEMLREEPALEVKMKRMMDASDEGNDAEYKRLREEIFAGAGAYFDEYVQRRNRERVTRGLPLLAEWENERQARSLTQHFRLNIQADVQRRRLGEERLPTMQNQVQALKNALDQQIKEKAEAQSSLLRRRVAEAVLLPPAGVRQWATRMGIGQPLLDQLLEATGSARRMEELLRDENSDALASLLPSIDRASLALGGFSFIHFVKMQLEHPQQDLRKYCRDAIPEDLRARGIDPAPDVEDEQNKHTYLVYARDALARLRTMEQEDTGEKLRKQAKLEQEHAEQWVRASVSRARALRSRPSDWWPDGTIAHLDGLLAKWERYETAEDWVQQTREGRDGDGRLLPVDAEITCVIPSQLLVYDEDRKKVVDGREATDKFLSFLEHPTLLKMTVEERKRVSRLAEREQRPNETPQARIERLRLETRRELSEVLEAIAPALDGKTAREEAEQREREGKPPRVPRRQLQAPFTHPICASDSSVLKLLPLLHANEFNTLQTLHTARGKEDAITAEAIVVARESVRRMRAFYDRVKRVQVTEEPWEGEEWDARYERSGGRIVINTADKSVREDSNYRRFLIEHEKGHLILHALEESGMMPSLTQNIYEKRRNIRENEEQPDSETFESLLRKLPKDSPFYRLYSETDTDALIDELLNRHADWIRAGKPDKRGNKRFRSDVERRLFALLERPTADERLIATPAPMQVEEFDDKGASAEKLRERLDDRKKAGASHTTSPAETVVAGNTTGDRRYSAASALGLEEEESATGAASSASFANMKQILEETRRNIHYARTFIKAYRDKYPDVVAALESRTDGFEQVWNEIKNTFEKDRLGFPNGRPEEDAEFIKLAQELNEETEKRLKNPVRKLDVANLDTTSEKRHPPTGLAGFFDGIKFLSIDDVMKLAKDTWEDVQSIYKRNQDRKLKNVGGVLTKALMKLQGVPIIGKYAGGFNAYHERRYSGAEVEASDKWKDGMKNIDTHDLLHFLHTTRDKDAVRGIITLLTERGEMDWNDEDVWRTLNNLPGANFRMPIGPCKRDDVLRDTWLRKMVSDIWVDKELYYHWRTSNDSKFESGKKEFTASADQLMNIQGGAKAELSKQLRLYIDSHNRHLSPPEDVKPHFYEEIIDYAIRNGKMTMEQKFYYLIRGIAAGILSIDRLRTLAGEKGGVLNQFPFIEYFYQKNNSLDEIKALASRLREVDTGGHDTFEPGSKTTLWLHLDVARDEGVRTRISKGTSGTRAENVDHEDVPFFVPQLDYVGVRSMADVISGTRQKMSPEALKNLYVGYSSQIKIFGMLAQMEDEEQDRFTRTDAQRLAQSMAAYIDYDNIITRRGFNKDERPQLSEYEFQTHPPSGIATTGDYRTQLNHFMGKIVDRFRDQIAADPDWVRYAGSGDIKIQPGDMLNEYAPRDGSFRSTNELKRGQKLYGATPFFVKALEKALMNNLDEVKKFMRSLATNLPNEAGSSGLNLDTVRKAYKEAKSSAASTAAGTGNGH